MEQIKHVVLVVVGLLLISCQTIPTMPIKVNVAASSKLNPDSYSDSLPVRVKIYQLTEPQLFNEATFRQLWKSDKAILGDTLLAKKEITVIPDEEKNYKIARIEEAQYIGILALFRKPGQSKWRVVKKLPGRVGSTLNTLHLTFSGNKMELQ